MDKTIFDVGPQGKWWYVRKDGVPIDFVDSEKHAIGVAEEAAQHAIPCVISVRNRAGKLVKQREILMETLDMDDDWIIIEDED